MAVFYYKYHDEICTESQVYGSRWTLVELTCGLIMQPIYLTWVHYGVSRTTEEEYDEEYDESKVDDDDPFNKEGGQPSTPKKGFMANMKDKMKFK